MFLFNFAERRRWYFLLSACVIFPGLVAMAISVAQDGSPVRLSIDFTGGTLLELPFVQDVDEQQARDALEAFGINDYTVQRLDPKSVVGDEAASRWQITLPAGTDPAPLLSTLQEALGEFWSPDSEGDDPDRTAAVGQHTQADGQVVLDVSFVSEVSESELQQTLAAANVTPNGVIPVATRPGSRWQIRMEELDTEQEANLRAFLQTPEQLGPIWSPDPNNIDSAVLSSHVSATVGAEVTRAAFVATMAVAVIILFYIVLAFRKVPHSFRYGACAIIAMFHDIFVTMGVMSILGLIFKWEANALFLTAVLTVVGYSVQDTIVVFDRIRENIPKFRDEEYEVIVNRSILQTLHRSLATQLNAVFVMFAILLFGGETIKQFIAIMLIGLLSGTYSSIFNAVPLLVSWEKGELPFVNREAKRKRKALREAAATRP